VSSPEVLAALRAPVRLHIALPAASDGSSAGPASEDPLQALFRAAVSDPARRRELMDKFREAPEGDGKRLLAAPGRSASLQRRRCRLNSRS
jgi:hypothetical protein